MVRIMTKTEWTAKKAEKGMLFSDYLCNYFISRDSGSRRTVEIFSQGKVAFAKHLHYFVPIKY